jgi:hypothetical protein
MKLANAGNLTCMSIRVYLGDDFWFYCGVHHGILSLGGGAFAGDSGGFPQGIPGSATGAFPAPFRGFGTAFGTEETGHVLLL